ncbi:phytase [Salinisphaera sp. Q1T1-3]|uniref:phytase n=1 Tax=Salinisphaera sp. Q1T1-3 TaxID=2321229 RepID=UPI000E71EEFB|nr:phytase [Salinisphaera sp. Q1T1-3]RJS93517.1 phytase [Salinisphaera sp. Q1T1-3]
MRHTTMLSGLLTGLALLGAGPATAQATADAADETTPTQLVPRYMTLRDEPANIDSVAAWHDGHGRHWLLATAKSTNEVRVYDADNGAPIASVGRGDGVDLARPNGIAVADDMAFVVERDHARVSVLALPSLQPIGQFGADHLVRPYGIWIGPANADGQRQVVITDDYINADDSRPADAALDHRLQTYRIARDGDTIAAHWQHAAGPTRGDGVLRKVESIAGDPAHDRLLVSDEGASQRDIKIFDLAGKFTGQTIGQGRFQQDPEGIARVNCGHEAGYWITTDQGDARNRFYVFDRNDLTYRGAFESPAVRNTDGIGLTQTAMPHFPDGALFTVNDDGNVAAFDLGTISRQLGPAACRDDASTQAGSQDAA